MRTWGGVRGIRGNWPLLDNGYITIPEGTQYGLDSQWVIENHGVDPDIQVDDLPGDVMTRQRCAAGYGGELPDGEDQGAPAASAAGAGTDPGVSAARPRITIQSYVLNHAAAKWPPLFCMATTCEKPRSFVADRIQLHYI